MMLTYVLEKYTLRHTHHDILHLSVEASDEEEEADEEQGVEVDAAEVDEGASGSGSGAASGSGENVRKEVNQETVNQIETLSRIEKFIEEEKINSSTQLMPTFIRLTNCLSEAKRGLRKRLHTNPELEKALGESASKKPRDDNEGEL